MSKYSMRPLKGDENPGPEATMERLTGVRRDNLALTSEADPLFTGGADMKNNLLIGVMAVGCACAAVATLVPSAQAQANRQPSNPAVQMAVATTLNGHSTPGVEESGSAFLQSEPVPDLTLVVKEPPLRITETFRSAHHPNRDDIQTMDLEFALSGRMSDELDITLAPRAGVSVGPDGRTGAGAGAELRIGQGLRTQGLRTQGLSSFVRPYTNTGANDSIWYLFAATDGSALTWRPETATEGLRGLRFQEERVLVGDAQLGVSAEFDGMQASVSLVNREISNGRDSTDQNFVGATLTWRR